MAKRFNKLTPIAASVALSFGLTGCLGDDDDNTSVPPLAEVEGTAKSEFNLQVSGRAVKGTLKNAMLSVKSVTADGSLIDIPFRSEVLTVEEKATSTSEAEAIKLAEKAILDANPSVISGDKGEYNIYLDSNFRGPIYITVSSKKEGDNSQVKCDSFVGCGDFGSESELDTNKNNKVDFGEWYKDDLELSVVKFIKVESANTASSKGIQYAEGDASASFKANLTVFTSAASSILMDNEINESAVANASSKVIRSLIGDEKLLPTLLADISLGGAVDFTDIDGSEALDAGVLTMMQIASSIQAVAAKDENGSISDVLNQLKNDVKNNNLSASDTFTALKEQSKTAGKILSAVVSGDTEAVKAALIEAGVDEQTAEETAAKAEEAKDTAVESGATTEDDLKEDADKSEKQLDDIGDGEAVDNAELAESLTTSLTELKAGLASIKTLMTTFESQLANVDALAAKEVKSNQDVVDYGVAATELSRDIEDSLIAQTSAQLTTTASQLVSSGNALAAKDAQYQAIADDAEAQKVLVESENTKVQSLASASSVHLDDAVKAVDELNLNKDFAKAAYESAIAGALEAEEKALIDERAFSTVSNNFEQAISASDSSQDVEDAKVIFSELETIYESGKNTAQKYFDDVINALEKANTYVEEAKSTDMESDSIASQQFALSKYSFAETLYNSVVGSERLNEMKTGVARIGTGQLVNVSAVSREGADAVFNMGEIIYDVVLDIVEDGQFETGTQRGTSKKYPAWSYEYTVDLDNKDLEFVFENVSDGQKVELKGNVVNRFSQSKLFFTWSGNLRTDSNQQIIMPMDAESLTQCEIFATDGVDDPDFKDNASCIAIHLNKDIVVSDPDTSDLEVLKIDSFNIVEFADATYGFDGSVSFDLTALDANGVSGPLFEDGSVEYLDLTVDGVAENTKFITNFNVKYDESVDEIGSMSISLPDYFDYQFSVNLVDETGPLVGEVSILNDDLSRSTLGEITEIENGFRIKYISNIEIEYTNIEVYGDR